MNELITRMKIKTTKQAAYEAFINPEELKKFWFTYSSARWESNTTVQLGYAEYNAPPFAVDLKELLKDEKIVFVWGDEAGSRTCTIQFEENGGEGIIVGVTEEGFKDQAGTTELLVDSKGGWTFMLTCLKAYLENGIDTLKLGLFVEVEGYEKENELD